MGNQGGSLTRTSLARLITHSEKLGEGVSKLDIEWAREYIRKNLADD
jgi:hypothetical protein